MTYTLVIVESPAKCNKIEGYLGKGYKCLASFGHLRKLPSLNNIDLSNNFALKFENIETKSNQIEKLQKAIDKSDDVILATDDDREGEAIAWHICMLFKLDVLSTKRMIFNEITKSAIDNALKNLKTLNLNLVYAQQTRQILDLLVGFKISPLLWQNIASKSKSSLSAGRCQTPALRLVYDNQNEINNNEGKKVYNTTGIFTNNNINFSLNYNYQEEKALINFLEKSKIFDHKFNLEKEREVNKNPPEPLTTSLLQQIANTELRTSPKETMSICQKLYEGGFITYMRTDSKKYSDEFIKLIKEYIKNNYGENYINDNIDLLSVSNKTTIKTNKKSSKTNKEDKNKAQEAHEAIRPTNIKLLELDDNYNSKEKRMYKLIWNITIESCMSKAKMRSLTAYILAPEERQYRNTCEIVIFKGWKIIRGIEDDKNYNYFKSMKQDNIINYKKILCYLTIKDIKSHYTEAKLVQLLEEKGIGRPSTFSSLIDKIQERNYVKKENIEGKKIKCNDYVLEKDKIEIIENEKTFGNEKNKLVIQPIGIFVLEFILKHFDEIFEYEYTYKLENELDKIAKGELEWIEICNLYYNNLNKLLIPISNSKGKKKSVILEDNYEYIIGKYGPVLKKEENGNIKFINVKKDIDINKLEKGEYKVEDIIENKKEENILGEYNGKKVILKSGKYGLYIIYDNVNYSIKDLTKKEEEIEIDDVIKFICKKENVRDISENLCIKNGKYGDYIFYKTKLMKTPKFYKLDKFELDYKKCKIDILKLWIYDTYNIK